MRSTKIFKLTTMQTSSLLKTITPTNLVSEKQKFFADSSYHPQFTYIWQAADVELISEKPSKLKFFDIIQKQDNSLITESAKQYFATKFENQTTKQAQKIISEYPKNLSINSDSEDLNILIKDFTKALQFFDLDYKLIVKPNAAFNIRPQPKTKTIEINQQISFQYFDVAGEVRHELTHIIRQENSTFNHINKSLNYLPTEEGLASFMQDFGGQKCAGSLFQHASEYLASIIGQTGSLRDIYVFLIDLGFNQELAWQRASRHKFGFVDTSKAGDIIKPAMYFAYEQKVKQLTNSQIYKLLLGKIALNELDNYPEYFGIFTLQLLEDFYQL